MVDVMPATHGGVVRVCSLLHRPVIRDLLDVVNQGEHLPLRIDFVLAPQRETVHALVLRLANTAPAMAMR